MYKSLDQYTRLATFTFQNVSGLVIDVASDVRDRPRSLRFPPSPPTGGTHQWPEIRGRPGLQGFSLRSFGPQFGLRIRGGVGGGASPGSATAHGLRYPASCWQNGICDRALFLD